MKAAPARLALALACALATVVACVLVPSQVGASFTARSSRAATFSSGSFPTYAQMVAAANPLGYYRLEDALGATTLADSSGRSNPAKVVHTDQYFGLAGSPAGGYDGGKSMGSAGNSILLPGSPGNGYVSSRDQLDVTSGISSTFEVWFRSTGTSGVLAELTNAAAGTSTTTDRVLTLTSNGALTFQSMGKTLTSAPGTNNGSWHLVQAVLAPGVLELYVDGALSASTSFTGTPSMLKGYVRFGGDASWFSGNLDGVAIYDAQLSASSVAAHWGSGTPTTPATYTSRVMSDSPWALWNLDDSPVGPWGQDDLDYPVPLADSGSRAHPGIARNLPPVAGLLGMVGALGGANTGASMRMDGAGWAVSTTMMNVANTFTYEMWIKTTTTTGGVLAVFTSVQGVSCHQSDGSLYRCGRMLFMDSTGKIRFGIHPGADLMAVTSSRPLNDGQWHYIVATNTVPATGTTSDLTLYIDNVLDASASVSKPNSFNGYFAFGGGGLPYTSTTTWPPSASFTGQLDEVAFYDSTLSPYTISTHWTARTRT